MTPRTLSRWEDEGLLVPVRIGARGRRRYWIADVEALIEASAGSALPADGGAPATTPGVDRAKNGPKRRY